MPKQQRQNQIEEIDSPAFEQGFFHGTKALQSDTYCCKEALDGMKKHGYIINSVSGQEFISGWKFSNQ